MRNFFKNLFGSGGDSHANGNGNGNGYAASAAPAAPVQVHARPVVAPKKPEAPMPRTPAAAAPTPAARPLANGNGNGVRIPLYTVIAVLPLELKTRIIETKVSDIFVTLPLESVLVQLGAGTVRISFGELRAMAPNVFSNQADLDQSEISLPLNEILPQINPALIARRQSQKHLQVPEDIHGPFGSDFAGVTLADPRTAAKPIAPAPSVQPKVTPPSMSPSPVSPAPVARPVQPPKPVTPIPFKPAAPAAPAPAPANDPIPMVPFRSNLTSTPTPRPPTAAPSVSPPVRPVLPAARGVGATALPTAAPRMPAMPTNGNGNGNGNGRPAVPRPAPISAPAPAAPVAAAAPGPEVFLSVPLASLSDAWPEVLRGEIQQLNLSEAHLALPVRFVEPALKQGKIAFTWKVLRSWIRPATLPTVSAHDGMMLELPLRVIAPLFISRQKKGAQPHQKVTVSEKIPNLFFGFPQGESAAAAVEEAIAAPVAAPAPAPAPEAQPEEDEANFSPKTKNNNSADTNFYVWNESSDAPQVDESAAKKTTPGTDFLTRYATPNEVVSRAAALEGVAGALVALPDGLMVASKLSADLNGDTLAAFLPHIFGKVSQCTKELRMGELNNLHFTVGNVPWKIFRVNAIFFAAFGHAGRPLPTGQLAALAGELDRKK
jgi:predicted regulator of Ras-like GTPase activity (Roadblock/LC7/MglB family)